MGLSAYRWCCWRQLHQALGEKVVARSTTVIARGKLRLMAQRGEEIPEGGGGDGGTWDPWANSHILGMGSSRWYYIWVKKNVATEACSPEACTHGFHKGNHPHMWPNYSGWWIIIIYLDWSIIPMTPARRRQEKNCCCGMPSAPTAKALPCPAPWWSFGQKCWDFAGKNGDAGKIWMGKWGKYRMNHED